MPVITFPHVDDNWSAAELKAVLLQINNAIEAIDLTPYAKLNDAAQEITAAGLHCIADTITAIYSDYIDISDSDSDLRFQLSIIGLTIMANLTDGLTIHSDTIARTVGAYTTTLAFTNPTANNTITFPNGSGVPVLSSSSGALFNIPVFTPGTPVDGDVWRVDNTNTGLKIRVNGVTKTITLS